MLFVDTAAGRHYFIRLAIFLFVLRRALRAWDHLEMT